MTTKFTWVRGVTLVAMLLASTGAHALKFVQTAGEDPGVAETVAYETVTYAKETLLKGTDKMTPASTSADKTMYYNIERGHFVSARPGVASQAGDTYILKYMLTGMVFSETPSSPPAGFTLATGGTAGDKEAIYRANNTTVVGKDTAYELTAKFAVSEGGGSVTLVAENRTFSGMKTHGPARIAVKPALKVTALPMVPAPQAKAASEFMNFGGSAAAPVLKASLGTFMVGVVSPNLEDAQAADNTAEDVDAFADIAPPAADPAEDPIANPVTFSVEGGFGFLTTLALANAPAADSTAGPCDGTLTEIRKAVTPATNPATYTDETMPKEAQDFEPNDASDPVRVLQYLCIEVDGETTIPATGPFMVMSKYKGITDAAFPPMAMTHSLASITRDGTAVHIPFLSLYEGYNHRIILRNRGSRSVTYSITFDPEDDTTAIPGLAASGTIDAGETKFLPAADVVSLVGRPRTAATLTAPARKGTLDVSTTLVNKSDGSTDTETFMAE